MKENEKNAPDMPAAEEDSEPRELGATVVELPEPCPIAGAHPRHIVGPPASPATCPGRPEEAVEDPLSYAAMLREYLDGQTWIGPAQQPLVHHLKVLCRKLDRDPEAPASLSSAYLQAVSRLDRQRPGAAPAVAGDLPGQRSIFDELD